MSRAPALPAYVDYKPTLAQQREHRRQMRRMFLLLMPCVFVALALLVRRFM